MNKVVPIFVNRDGLSATRIVKKPLASDLLEEGQSLQGKRIKFRLNYRSGLDSDKCTALRFFGLSPFFRRNAWLLLLPWLDEEVFSRT